MKDLLRRCAAAHLRGHMLPDALVCLGLADSILDVAWSGLSCDALQLSIAAISALKSLIWCRRSRCFKGKLSHDHVLKSKLCGGHFPLCFTCSARQLFSSSNLTKLQDVCKDKLC